MELNRYDGIWSSLQQQPKTTPKLLTRVDITKLLQKEFPRQTALRPDQGAAGSMLRIAVICQIFPVRFKTRVVHIFRVVPSASPVSS